MSNEQQQVGYIPAISKAAMKELGIEHVELGCEPTNDGILLQIFAVEGRTDAGVFDHFPNLSRFARPATERERNTFGLPLTALAVVSRTQDGCIFTEYVD